MPIPLILGGIAIAAGVIGVKKGIDAKSDMDKAKNVNCCCSRCLTAPWSNSLSVNLSHIA